LYPSYQQEAIQKSLANNDPRNKHVEIRSIEGHDGFLLEIVPINRCISEFFASTEGV
jgi:homoserine acetyltransferase